MLKDNLKILRKNKGLSQEELSIKLHVVRQTVSKWESGLSVPDAEMLMTISEILEAPVSEILGESIEEKEKNDLKVISEKLEVINEQLAMKQKQKMLFPAFLLFFLSLVLLSLRLQLILPYSFCFFPLYLVLLLLVLILLLSNLLGVSYSFPPFNLI